MTSKSSVNLGPFARSRDITVVHNEYHGLQLPEKLVEELAGFLTQQRENGQRSSTDNTGVDTLLDLFIQAVNERNVSSTSELLRTVGDRPALGSIGCEAAIILGDTSLMEECMSSLDSSTSTFWEARIALLSSRQADSIKIVVENLEEICAAGLDVAAFRGLCNALSDLGFWEPSMAISQTLLQTNLVKNNDSLKAKVLTDLLRARCRASLEVSGIADRIEQIVIREVNQWQEQIFSLELKKWSVIWKIERRYDTNSIEIESDTSRLTNINLKSGNRFSPMIFKTIEALGHIYTNQLDQAHKAFGEVVSSASIQPYCSYLSLEALQFARRYFGDECALVVDNADILTIHETQKREIEQYLDDQVATGIVKEKLRTMM